MSQVTGSALRKICATCGRQISWRKKWKVSRYSFFYVCCSSHHDFNAWPSNVSKARGIWGLKRPPNLSLPPRERSLHNFSEKWPSLSHNTVSRPGGFTVFQIHVSFAPSPHDPFSSVMILPLTCCLLCPTNKISLRRKTGMQ
jgi:hypothetical protein